MDLARSSRMSAARNISSEASRGAAEKIGGGGAPPPPPPPAGGGFRRHLEGGVGAGAPPPPQPAAPTAGRNSGSIWKRVLGSCPHQPDNRAGALSKCFWCTKQPPIAPGPAFRYLYEHHTAKSAPQSCSDNGRLPMACAMSNP